MRNHEQSNGTMEDFCDSPKAKTHPLFSIHKTALQILLYFDECELCNPLGSFRKKHKLGENVFIYACVYIFFRIIGCYYYTLGNIHPSFRSTLSSIQLLCLVEVLILEKYGHDLILKPAIVRTSKSLKR